MPAWAIQSSKNSDRPSNQQSLKRSSDSILISGAERSASVAELRKRNLVFPIHGFNVERIKNSYSELRGNKPHEASDILAPRETPILAVENGIIAKLFLSRFGGTTIYQFDPSKRYIYYYAHLERYASGLKSGDSVAKGQVIGYVGTSGDAPKTTPHLHFSISVLGPRKEWWHAAPIDPYLVFQK